MQDDVSERESIDGLPAAIAKIVAKAPESYSKKEKNSLRKHYLSIDPVIRKAKQKVTAANKTLTSVAGPPMLNDALVVWGGEFGQTSYCQGALNAETYGRDHHPRCFSIWMTGAGVKKGIAWGATDDVCYNVVENPVHVHDLHATMMHLLGIDHEKLTYRFQGRYFRLTDVHGKIVKRILT